MLGYQPGCGQRLMWDWPYLGVIQPSCDPVYLIFKLVWCLPESHFLQLRTVTFQCPQLGSPRTQILMQLPSSCSSVRSGASYWNGTGGGVCWLTKRMKKGRNDFMECPTQVGHLRRGRDCQRPQVSGHLSPRPSTGPHPLHPIPVPCAQPGGGAEQERRLTSCLLSCPHFVTYCLTLQAPLLL